jgi:hypothetical protein
MTPTLWMDTSEWTDYVPENVGSVRVNHDATYCSGDSKSMIVERKENGDIAAHCFRCGGRGFIRATPYFVAPTPHGVRTMPRYDASGKFRLPDDASGEWGAYPREVRAWLGSGGITSVINDKHGFQWSDSRASLFMPVRQGSRITSGFKTVGLVERKFNPKAYWTRTEDKDSFFAYYPTADGKTVVMVEDVVSAIRVSEVCDCVALMGVHAKPAVIERVLQDGYRECVVFLDGDNATVRMKAREIGRHLPFMATRVVETGKDPKSYSREELSKLLLTTT